MSARNARAALSLGAGIVAAMVVRRAAIGVTWRARGVTVTGWNCEGTGKGVVMRELRILSLGAGVQSSTVLLMSLAGEIAPIDHAIFADTGWEPPAVYAQLWRLAEISAGRVPIHIVSAGDIRADTLRSASTGERSSNPPFWTETKRGKPSGMLTRKCTRDYKVRPLDRKVRELCGFRPRQRIPDGFRVRRLIGISRDEASRAKAPERRWEIHEYPLLGYAVDHNGRTERLPDGVGREMTRQNCKDWCASHGFGIPPKSACVCCPYRRGEEWRRMREADGEQWADLVAFDATIRDGLSGTHDRAYVHSMRLPINEAVDAGAAQRSLFDLECTGLCGV